MFKMSKKDIAESARIKKKEEDALEALRNENRKRRAEQSKKIVIEESEDEDVPSIFLIIKNLVETGNGGLVDDKMLAGVNRSEIIKYLKNENIQDKLIPAILKQSSPKPAPVPSAPAPVVNALPAEKAKQKPGPKTKPKAPTEKKPKKHVDKKSKPMTDLQTLNMIWTQMAILKKDTDPDTRHTSQQALNALKDPHVFNRIDPAKVKKFFLKKGEDVPSWMQNYTYIVKEKKPRGRPPKAKPVPTPPPPAPVDNRLQSELTNVKNENKFLFRTNEQIRREIEAKDEKLFEAQKYISELENTIREYEADLARCRAENAELKQARDKQIAKNELGMMGAEDINVLKFPEPAVKKPTITKTQSTDLLNLLNDLETKGKKYEKTGIHFTPNDLLGMIMYTYLIEKYNSDCFIYGYNDTIGYQPLLIDISEFGLLGDNEHVLKYQKYIYHMIMLILDCIKKIQTTSQEVIIIPLIIQVMENSHINMLIYRKSLNVLEHYEPYGNQIPNVTDLNANINRILNLIVNKMNQINVENKYLYVPNNIQYLEPSNICPINKGFQTIENELILSNKIEKGGFCMIWSIFFAEMTLENPSLTSKEIFDSIFNNLNNDSLKVKSLIRGYLSYLYDTILNIVQQISGKSTITYKQIQPLLSTKKFQKLFNNFIQDKFQKYNKIDIKKYFEKPEPENVFSEFNISNIKTTEPEMMGAEDTNVAKDESSKLFSFFNNLQVKGKEYETTGIQYTNNGQMINILTHYLNNKYGLSCRIRGKNNNPLTFDLAPTATNLDTIQQFEKKLAKCIRELSPSQNMMFIPISQKVGNTGHHVNMLIYRKDTNRIEHYDPLGNSERFKKFTTILRPIFERMNIEYSPSTRKVGFQRIEDVMRKTLGPDILEREGNLGFCIMWSFLIAELALTNPTMSVDDILKYLVSKVPTSKEEFLRNTIRGYTHYMYESLSALLKDKYNIDLDLTQKVDKPKILGVIKEMDKVYNEPVTQARELEQMGAEDINIKPPPPPAPKPTPVPLSQPPPAKYQNIIAEWDSPSIPYIFYQDEPKIYDAIEKKVNSLVGKNHSVVIADLLFFIKPFVNELFDYYGGNINALNIIQDGMVFIVKYINSDAEPVRDDTSYLGKFFNKKNQKIIYDISTATKREQSEMEQMGAQDINILKFPDPTVICDDNNYCIAFGKSDKVLKLFDDLNFKYVSQMNTLSSGAHGFLLTINYLNKQYKLSTILKSSTRSDSSNLAYEYIVGQMINRYNKLYPCFVETYHLFKYKTKKSYETIKKKYRGTNTTPDTEYLQNGLEPVTTKFDLSNIDSTCDKSILFCIQIQYIENSITLGESMLNTDFVRNELANVLYQIYTPLAYMSHAFTHYDLHPDNVLVLKPYTDMYFEYNYHFSPTNIITFNSQYIAKIIDYGNAHFNNMNGFNTKSVVDKLKEKFTSLQLSESGYGLIAKSKDITPQVSNFSADLRLLSILKKMYKSGPLITLFKDVVFTEKWSTPANNKTDGKINNIIQAKERLEARIKEENFLHTLNNDGLETRFKKVGTIHVYMDNKTPMKYVSAI